MSLIFNREILFKTILIKRSNKLTTFKMAKSSFEYVKMFELDDTLLPNSWIVVRLDGKCFHKFSEDHDFSKPNDIRALRLMNYAAFSVFKEFHDLLMAFGQSDEYSFIFKKHTTLYNRRASKLLTTINSKFSSSYVYYWSKFFGTYNLKYPPTFDGRIILYPSDENLIDYMKWRQADVHINNLYNTTFWNLVLKGNMSPTQAEKRLCGTVSANKNEILYNEFHINYNNEPDIYKRGTLLLRKIINNQDTNKTYTVIVDIHDDMLKEIFWKEHSTLLTVKPSKQNFIHIGPITDIIEEQLKLKEPSE
ncbi:probable tRNA(His) guanylyltransferase [Galleria mellonella]|uniref:Probable tRNA(His) guanylyltransferase n=1 Tax=Galleria mellonella TaxID=7137 RepID=A0A6J1WPT7_GALME|nr:probable tRNA(His) guanylyltransferase [Galleria mellonella]